MTLLIIFCGIARLKRRHSVKLDLARRAQIGQERRARTRSQLIEAAVRLISRQAIEAITVDEVVKEAGVAKGTFYVHFVDMHALILAVADGLVEGFDDMLQPKRVSMSDPFEWIAFCCASFIEAAIENPGWASVVGRMTSSYPSIGRVARERLSQDVKDLAAQQRDAAGIEPTIVMEAVVGALMQVLGAISAGRIHAGQGRAALEPILRITGANHARIRRALAVVERLTGPRDAKEPRTESARVHRA